MSSTSEPGLGDSRGALAREVERIRHGVAYSECHHVTAVRVSGPAAFEVVDAVCPRELYVQDGQMLHTLLLDDAAGLVADAYVCADGDDFILLLEGLSVDALRAYLEHWAPRAAELTLTDLSVSQRLVSLNGPYAWELLSEVLGPELIGLPYLGFYHGPGFTCFRAGKTGEYGYDLWLDRQADGGFFERLLSLGREFDLGAASLEALDACALENWFLNMRREGQAGLSPIELQLQWRVSYHKTYPGSARLAEKRKLSPRRRAVLIASDTAFQSGEPVLYAGERVGEVLRVEPSLTRGDMLGIALLGMPYAHPGLGPLDVGSARVSVISAPSIDNRSLYVDPQRHAYRTRHEHIFPPIVSRPG